MRLLTITTVLMFFALITGCQTTQSKVSVSPGVDQPGITNNAQNIKTPAPAPANWTSLSLEGISM